MKTVSMAIICISLFSTTVMAGFKLAKGVYRIDQLEEAKSEALSNGKPLTFMYSRMESTCPLACNSSEKVMDELRKKTVMVYINSSEEYQKAPKLVQEALNDPQAGKFIPKTVTCDAELTKTIAFIPYASGKEQEKVIRNAKRTISKSTSNQSRGQVMLAGRKPPQLTDVGNSSQSRIWTDTRGRQLEAVLFKVTSSTATLKRKDGSTVNIQIRDLSHNDQIFLLSAHTAP